MTEYTAHQLQYFGRYVAYRLNGTSPSLQTINSLYNDWLLEKPNEVNDKPLTVEQQLELDLKIHGNAYYQMVGGKKVRIDPTTIVHTIPYP